MYFWDKHKTITSYYELLSGEVCDRYELTQMEYDILMFLHNNPQHNTAADIVKIRKSTKSHVSTSLKNLENKGLVERIQSKDNKKHIEIVLLDKAEVIVKAGINAQKQFAKDVLSGLTEEEKHMCIDVFDKICNNAEKYLKDFNWDDYVVLLNSPNYDYNMRYHQGLYDNVAGGQPITGLNVPIEVLARAAAAQLKDGRAVIFGNDVLKQMERKTGFLDTDLYKTDDLFSVDTQMSKADRLATGEGSATHDMTLVGVDEDNG